MTGHWLLLPLILVIPLSETLSVILQIGYFKISKGKRLFKMAPSTIISNCWVGVKPRLSNAFGWSAFYLQC